MHAVRLLAAVLACSDLEFISREMGLTPSVRSDNFPLLIYQELAATGRFAGSNWELVEH